MKRLIVQWNEGSCNIEVTKIETERGYTVAYNGDEFVAVFDNEYVNVLYVSEQRTEVKR